MKQLLTTLAFIFVTGSVHAGVVACHDVNGAILEYSENSPPVQGAGCLYFGIPPNTVQEFESLKTLVRTVGRKYVKYDAAIVTGIPIREMTQSEKDTVNAADLANEQNRERQNVDRLEVTIEDALTALVQVYNSKVPAANRITKQEIIDRIKTNKGL
jgi:hypothetical protein